jgi:dTDP-4-dehydrorhamnose 3,5-epimerase
MISPTQIDGVLIKRLEKRPDKRGFFIEIVKKSDGFFQEGFGQCAFSRMHPGVIKGWHFHKKQVDWWHVPKGNLLAVVHDSRKDSPTFTKTEEFLMGEDYDPIVLRIPPGVLHGCKVIGGSTDLFYITSEEYDGTDEYRVEYNDPSIGYDWLKKEIK